MNKRILLSAPHMSGNELKYIEKVFQSNYISPNVSLVGGINIGNNTVINAGSTVVKNIENFKKHMVIHVEK